MGRRATGATLHVRTDSRRSRGRSGRCAQPEGALVRGRRGRSCAAGGGAMVPAMAGHDGGLEIGGRSWR
jgi:hypothetical protein